MKGGGGGRGGGIGGQVGGKDQETKSTWWNNEKNNIWLLSYLIRKEGSFESNIKFPFLRQNRKYFGRYTAKPVPQLKTFKVPNIPMTTTQRKPNSLRPKIHRI